MRADCSQSRQLSAIFDRGLRAMAFVLVAVAFSTANFAPSTAFAKPNTQQTVGQATQHLSAAQLGITPAQMESYVGNKIYAVEEFRFIAEEAERLGLRVYLFGGTASAFLHYSKWDMQRQKGDPRFQADRFDYDFTNIFRSTQDLDIVVDGDVKNVEQLRSSLQARYPHFAGSKAQWEVRLLKQSMGEPGQPSYKEALLDSYDFNNQNTDSNSTGLIEISKTPERHRILDLRNWEKAESQFLVDSLNDRIHYFDSPIHDTTSRAKIQQNPKVLSVIRALTKAFQYELTFSAEDRKVIQKIIDQADPSKENEVTRRWIIKNAKKLFQHAVDLEFAANVLDQLGLREKLINLDSSATAESLAWWMNKVPLKSKPLGEGSGATAAEIFGAKEIILAHETSGFLAYESISRSHKGVANFFISRQHSPGETAAFGDGVYTQVGTLGARNTGFTIRMKLNPKARLGTDFTLAHNNLYVILQNRNAVQIIPESINMSSTDLFKMVAEGKEFSQADRGIYEKVLRRAALKANALTTNEKFEIREILKDAAAGKFKNGQSVASLMFDLKLSPRTLSLSPEETLKLSFLSYGLNMQGLNSVTKVEEALISFARTRFGPNPPVAVWIRFQEAFPTWTNAQWLESAMALPYLTHVQGTALRDKVVEVLTPMSKTDKAKIFDKWITETRFEFKTWNQMIFPISSGVPDFGTLEQWLRYSSRIAENMGTEHSNAIRIVTERVRTLSDAERKNIRKILGQPELYNLVDLYMTGLYDLAPDHFSKLRFESPAEFLIALRSSSEDLIKKVIYQKWSELLPPGVEPPVVQLVTSALFRGIDFNTERGRELARTAYKEDFIAKSSDKDSWVYVVQGLVSNPDRFDLFVNILEVIEKNKNRIGLEAVASQVHIAPTPEANIFAFIKTAEAMGHIDLIAKIAGRFALMDKNNVKPDSPEMEKLRRVQGKMLEVAERTKNKDLIEMLAGTMFVGQAHAKSMEYLERIIQLSNKHQVKVLNMLATNAYETMPPDARRHQYLKHHQRVLKEIVKQKDTEALDYVASRHNAYEYPAEYYLEVNSVIQKFKEEKALLHMTATSGSQGFAFTVGAALRLRNAGALRGMIHQQVLQTGVPAHRLANAEQLISTINTFLKSAKREDLKFLSELRIGYLVNLAKSGQSRSAEDKLIADKLMALSNRIENRPHGGACSDLF
jgi:hypothetical protein